MVKIFLALLKRFTNPFLQAFLNFLVGEATVVLSIVESLKVEDLTDSEKRQVAFDRIKRWSDGAGKRIKDNAIHNAIGIAIDILKSKVA